MKKVIALVLISAALLAVPVASYAAVMADIVFIIDDSRTMKKDIPSIKALLSTFNDAMVANNVDAMYSVIKFGYVEKNLTGADPVDFADLAVPLSTLKGRSGNPERGSSAVSLALSSVTFREGAVPNVILITDEDDDSRTIRFTQANADLTALGAYFNFIGKPGVGNTDNRYGVLAADNKGQGFSISSFRSNPAPFIDDFINVKLAEIGDVPTPEPTTLVLLAIGGMAMLNRRNRKTA